MKIRYAGMAALAGSVLLCFGLPAFGQDQVSVQFTGGYTTTFANGDGDFGAGVYSATINGSSSPGIICDDYQNEITSGETWTANAYSAASLVSSTNPTLGDTLFGGTIGVTGYAEVATLVSAMFGDVTSLSFNGTTVSAGSLSAFQSALSAAIWDITTPGGISGVTSGTTAYALVQLVVSEFGGNASAATAYLKTLTNLWILTPVANSENPSTYGYPQEMWTENLSVPEGGAAILYLLLAGFTCFGAMFRSTRKQAVKRIAA